MSTSFPAALDSLTNPVHPQTMGEVPHDAQHTNANDAIEAIEAKIGINSSDDTASIDYRIRTIEAWSAASITALQISQWNTAYGWGDHADGGYALAANVPPYSGATGPVDLGSQNLTTTGLGTFGMARSITGYTLHYDSEGRVDQKTYDGGYQLTYTYDVNGVIETKADGTKTWTYTKDADGNILSVAVS